MSGDCINLIVCSGLLGFALAGCASNEARDLGADFGTTIRARLAAEAQACNTSIPIVTSETAMARAKCEAAALSRTRPYEPYPDLIDSIIVTRLAVAEQIHSGTLTVAQANEIIAEKNSVLTAEQLRRDLLKRAADAQLSAQRAAAAASILSAIRPPSQSVYVTSCQGMACLYPQPPH